MYSKELLRGTLTTVVLQVLKSNGRMYGYEIAQKVKDQSGDEILLKEGSLYPLLHKLESEGKLRSEDELHGKRLRRYYVITESGKEEAARQAQEIVAFFATMRKFIDPLPDMEFSI
jgi:DNA-binding PadR family transcriptional regulator